MTASKGMLWKTAWKRRTGGFIQQPPVDMWFLNATYDAAAAAPSFTQGPVPFWFGFIALGPGPNIVDAQVVSTDGIFIEYLDSTISTGADSEILLFNVNPTNGIDGLLIPDPASPGTPSVGPIVPYLPGTTVTVGFCYVYPHPTIPGQNQFQVWVDALPYDLPRSGPAYVAATTAITISGLFNGVVGGVGTLTVADVQNWFANVKQQLQVVPAPGMTDIWSATAVAPLAPAILPNGGGGQSLTLMGMGTNTLLPVVFNY